MKPSIRILNFTTSDIKDLYPQACQYKLVSRSQDWPQESLLRACVIKVRGWMHFPANRTASLNYHCKNGPANRIVTDIVSYFDRLISLRKNRQGLDRKPKKSQHRWSLRLLGGRTKHRRMLKKCSKILASIAFELCLYSLVIPGDCTINFTDYWKGENLWTKFLPNHLSLNSGKIIFSTSQFSP